MWRVLANDPAVTAEWNVLVFDWGIRVDTHLQSVSLTWANFDSFRETRDLIVIRNLGRRYFAVFPKRDLDAAKQLSFLTLLSQHVRRR